MRLLNLDARFVHAVLIQAAAACCLGACSGDREGSAPPAETIQQAPPARATNRVAIQANPNARINIPWLSSEQNGDSNICADGDILICRSIIVAGLIDGRTVDYIDERCRLGVESYCGLRRMFVAANQAMLADAAGPAKNVPIRYCFRDDDNVQELMLEIQGERAIGEYQWRAADSSARQVRYDGSIQADTITATYESMQPGEIVEGEFSILLETDQAMIVRSTPRLGPNAAIARVDC